jgi:hypothetical protein
MKKVIITQSNYIPWKGYFYSISMTDLFVVYDDVQYTKRDWRNRNRIKTSRGLRWLTIPIEVRGKFYQKIREAQIADTGWATNHWQILKECYKSAPCYKEVHDWVENLYRSCTHRFLTDINLFFITNINDFLGIRSTIRLSSELGIDEMNAGKTQNLLQLCKKVGASDYFSGPAAQNYIDESLFQMEKIKIHYWDHSHYPEYIQPYPPFNHQVSIFDLIFCTGANAGAYLNKETSSLIK